MIKVLNLVKSIENKGQFVFCISTQDSFEQVKGLVAGFKTLVVALDNVHATTFAQKSVVVHADSILRATFEEIEDVAKYIALASEIMIVGSDEDRIKRAQALLLISAAYYLPENKTGEADGETTALLNLDKNIDQQVQKAADTGINTFVLVNSHGNVRHLIKYLAVNNINLLLTGTQTLTLSVHASRYTFI